MLAEMTVSPTAAFAAAEDAMAGPFVWGRSDCCTAACDAFAALFGVDPIRAFRGRYSSRRQADRLILCHGGMVSLATEVALAAGLIACGPIPGALGLGSGGLMLGLGDGRWAMKGQDGMVIRRGDARAWTWARP